MKKVINILLICIFAFMLTMPFDNVMAAKKVKVYLFEAGGCPYCEAEEEYLKSLSSDKEFG